MFRNRKGFAVLLSALVVLSAGCSMRDGSSTTRAAGLPENVREAGWIAPNVGWALTDRRLLVTGDAGLTWREVTPPGVRGVDIQDVFFLDGDHAWVAMLKRPQPEEVKLVVYRTTDGGKNWAGVETGLPPDAGGPVFLYFLDVQTGWAAVRLESSSNFSRGALLATRDGGATWQPRTLPLGEPVRFMTPMVGWTAGGPAGNKLFRTQDGGVTWEPEGVPAPEALIGAERVYHPPVIVSNEEALLPVTFSGRPSAVAFYQWTRQQTGWVLAGVATLPDPVDLGARVPLAVLAPDTWLVLTPNGARAFATRDRGRSWDVISPNGLPAGVTHVSFATPRLGWAVVGYGICAAPKQDCSSRADLYRTTDGGQTWTVVEFR